MIRIGIIGAGPNGAGNARQFVKFAGRCRVAAVADPALDKAKELAEELQAHAFADYNELLPEVDAVIVSSPNFLHPDQAVACAQAGKHLWIEKPMALNSANARRIVQAVEANKVQSMIGFSVRFTGQIVQYKEYLDEGKLGPVLTAWARRLGNFGQRTAGSWRGDFRLSGGIISEIMAHEIDWMVYLLGQPTLIFCQAQSRLKQHPRDNDHVWLTMRFASGAVATLEGSQMSPMPEYYRGVSGETATVFSNKWSNESYYRHAAQKNSEEPARSIPPDFDKHAHFLDIIEGKCASVADARYSAKIVRLTELALDSAETGQAKIIAKEDLIF